MDKKSKIALYSISAIILFMIIAEVTKPKALDWRDSYSSLDKIPLGCYVLHKELNQWSKNDVINNNIPLYEFLKQDNSTQSTLILINDFLYFDKETSESILKFIEKGNNVLMSSNDIRGKIMDSLNIEIKRNNTGLFKEPSTHTFESKNYKDYNTYFDDVIENSYITKIDTIKTTIIGSVLIEDDDIENTINQPNLIAIPLGENGGQLYVHSNPFAFSNYHLLNGNEKYAAAVLSIIAKNQFIWDNTIKSGKRVIKSPIRFILQNNALKWAFYIALFSLILFVIFKGKRTQRIIPVIKPLENATVDFTKTIGELYFQTGDYKNIIDKKITYFLEYVRTSYFVNTANLDNKFITTLATKSNNSVSDTRELIDVIIQLKTKTFYTEEDLLLLNKKIESFKKHNQ